MRTSFGPAATPGLPRSRKRDCIMKPAAIDDAPTPALPRLLFGPLVEQLGFAQIELPFNSPPRYVGQDAAPVLLVDVPALCADQQKLDLVVQVAEVSVPLVEIVAVLDVFEPVALPGSDRPEDLFRELPRGSEFVEPAQRRNRCLPPGLALFGLVSLMLAAPGVREPQRTDHRWEHQALPDERHQDHRERQKQDQIAAGEWHPGFRRKRDRQCRGERDDAANPGECEDERLLPGRRRVAPADSWRQPAR